MKNSQKNKSIIGRAEKVDLPQYKLISVPAKIDTGAHLSSVWASKIVVKDGRLSFFMMGPSSPFFTGVRQYVDEFEIAHIRTSGGLSQKRYVIELAVRLERRRIRGKFTLADRSKYIYPVLIGRRIIRGKFVVDVTKGDPLPIKEGRRRHKTSSPI